MLRTMSINQNTPPIPETLHLTLRKKWFDMVISGEKPEEYREVKPYWFKRLVFTPKFVCKMFNKNYDELDLKDLADLIKRGIFLQTCPFVPFKTVTFRNGYGSKVREVVVEMKGIKIRTGNPEWGAEKDVAYFVIELGEILSTNNLKS